MSEESLVSNGGVNLAEQWRMKQRRELATTLWALLRAEWAQRPPVVHYRQDKIDLLIEAIREDLPVMIRNDPELSRSDKVELLSVAGGIERGRQYLADPAKVRLALFIATVYMDYGERLLNFVDYSED